MPTKGVIHNTAPVLNAIAKSGLSQEAFAGAVEVSLSFLKKLIKGRAVTPDFVKRVATYSGIPYSEFVTPGDDYSENLEALLASRRYNFEGGVVNAIPLYGADTDYATRERVMVEYDPSPFMIRPPRLKVQVERWLAQKEEEVKRKKKQGIHIDFFNGPCARLVSVGSQLESSRVHILLGSIGWHAFSGLWGVLARKVTPHKYEQYLGLSHILRDGNITHSKLGNIFCCAVTLITSDGYAGYQIRGVSPSADPGAFTSTVAENINRFLDETSPDGLPLHIHENKDPRGSDNGYVPEGRNVPHPFTAARRGIISEISPRLEEHADALKLAGVVYSLRDYEPTALFVVPLSLTREKLLGMYSKHHPKEFSEGRLKFTKATLTDPDTVKLLARDKWITGGKASLVRALQLIDAISFKNRLDWGGAFEYLRTEGN